MSDLPSSPGVPFAPFGPGGPGGPCDPFFPSAPGGPTHTHTRTIKNCADFRICLQTKRLPVFCIIGPTLLEDRNKCEMDSSGICKSS